MMSSGDIASVLRILKQFKRGYFTLTDEDGDQFVVARKEEFERSRKNEQQLVLPPVPTMMPKKSADDLLDRINREIAIYQAQQQEDDFNVDTNAEEDDLGLDLVKKRDVRFEPLKGDLPPELQG